MSAFRKLTAGIVFDRKTKPKGEKVAARSESSVPPVEEEGQDVSALRSKFQIEVDGEDVPDPITSFFEIAERYQLPDGVLDRLATIGYLTPTPIQMQAIPLMLENREIICSAPTGSGKTLAFVLPLISHLKSPERTGFRAIILAPTRELAKQIHSDFLNVSQGTDLRIHLIKNVHQAARRFSDKSKGLKDVLVTTPNRLLYLLVSDPPALSLKHLQWLIIDECDKLFEEDFREALSYIYKCCSESSNRVRRAMFSATFSDELAEWFRMNLDNVVSLIVGGKNCATQTVEQSLQFVGNEEGKEIALRNLILKGLDVPVVIFVDHIRNAKRVFKHLISSNINADCIHSDRPQVQRDKVVRAFREGKIHFLVSTEVLGRGIDFRAVNTIINYDCPTSAVSYIHRIGRTGRAGRFGKAITFYKENDVPRLRAIIAVMKRSGYQLPEFLTALTERKTHVKSVKGEKRNRNKGSKK